MTNEAVFPTQVHHEATLFVVDDDPSVLRSLSRLLRVAGYCVEVFPSAQAFLEREHYAGLGCLIVDLRMPGMSGLELQQEVLKLGYTLPIVFLTAHADIPTTVLAVKAGAIDLLTKPFERGQLLNTVYNALNLHREILVEKAQIDQVRCRFELLSPREQQVCLLVGRGMLNKEIAWQLGLSERTVKIHRARVMDKVQANSVAELVDLLHAIGAK